MWTKNVPPKISIPVGLVLFGIGKMFASSWGGILEFIGELMFLFGLAGAISAGIKAAYARIKNKPTSKL